MSPSVQEQVQALLERSHTLKEDEVRRLIAEEPDLAVFLILEQARLLLQTQPTTPAPSTPSGMVPVYEKPATKSRAKTNGQKAGHPGKRRATPLRIDQHIEHRLQQCPDCGGDLQRCNSKNSKRTRIIEDIPEDIQPVVTEHTIHRDYCPACKKLVEPKVPDALPGATIGNRVLVLSAHWHYGLGLTLSQIVLVLNSHLHFPVSEGGLIQMWHRLGRILQSWYEQLVQEAQNAAVLHADETGWRVNGKTHWLWCFSSKSTTVYFIDRSRGSPALLRFFQEAFDGILVTDFWAAYDALACGDRQFCLAHLLRELEKVDKSNTSEEWCAFSKKARRLFMDALRLYHREGYCPQEFSSRIERLQARLVDLMLSEASDKDVRRLCKRLEKYWLELLTFLRHPEVPPTNNHAEREIRPAVIMRKVMGGNRSDKGASTQAILMSIYRTLRRRGHDPLTTLLSALNDYIRTNTLPPFPAPTSNG